MKTFLFADIETTGHEPVRRVGDVLVPWNEIIDIGAVLVSEDLSVIAEFSTNVTPMHPERCIPKIVNDYPARAERGEWYDAAQLPKALADLLNFQLTHSNGEQSWLVGQNFSFDWSFLQVAFAWCGIDEQMLQRHFHYARLDTRSMAIGLFWKPGTAYVPDHYSIRTGTIAQTLGIEPEPYPHRAINGARQSFEIFRKLR